VLFAPKASVGVLVPPRSPAFYNPHAKLSRDISMLLYRAASRMSQQPTTMADSLAGIGARGIRVAVEVPEINEVHINDLNPIAIRYSKASAAANGVLDKCRFTCMDACQFLMQHSSPRKRFHIIDIDPFGTPAPYLDCAMKAVKRNGCISVTATDSPVLCGIYPNVAFRRYNGYSLRTEYCHEVGIRLLLGALARVAMRFDIGILPLFSHNTRHYVRVYVKVIQGVSMAEKALENLGYVNHCFNCGHRSFDERQERTCPACGMLVRIGGPLWIGNLHDEATLDMLISLSCGQHRQFFERAYEELRMPQSYYIPDRLADDLQVSSSSLSKLIEGLKKNGYKASRTVINPKGVRSDAPVSFIKSLIKNLSA
jgi:tRNA (guanine26-N2/guanine27-N2)-dimethyltransferase